LREDQLASTHQVIDSLAVIYAQSCFNPVHICNDIHILGKDGFKLWNTQCLGIAGSQAFERVQDVILGGLGCSFRSFTDACRVDEKLHTAKHERYSDPVWIAAQQHDELSRSHVDL
jgi:hypothetical protein